MPTKTASYVEFDVSELPVGASKGGIVGLDVSREPQPLSFKGRVREIEGYGKSFGELFQEGIDGDPSLALDQEAKLWNAYLSAQRGLWKPTEGQMAYLNHKFDRHSYGNILQTIVDYDAVNYDTEEGEGVRALEKRKDSDRRVLLINRPDEVVTKDVIIVQANGS